MIYKYEYSENIFKSKKCLLATIFWLFSNNINSYLLIKSNFILVIYMHNLIKNVTTFKLNKLN